MSRGTPGSARSRSNAGLLVPYPRLVEGAGVVSFDRLVADIDPVCAPAAALIQASGLMPRPAARDAGTALTLRVGSGPRTAAWQDVAKHTSGVLETLPAEGYVLMVSAEDERPWAAVAGADPAGAYYGVQTLLALVDAGGDRLELPAVTVTDWPGLGWRGTIEGFYGPPWSHRDRLTHLEFAGRHKLNAYVYAPKDDPFHRARWREPYPATELAQLAELVTAARAHHIRFVFTISPGLSMVYSDPAELELLHAKLAQVWEIGVRDIGLLFDDIEPELTHDADIARFGAEPGSSALAHAAVCRQVIEDFLRPRGAGRPLLMVPTDYAGMAASPYREHLAHELPDEVLVWWTGRDIVVGDVDREHIDQAEQSYRHRLLLWDNFPVNDFDFSRVFLGPLLGRTTDLDGAPMAGVTANPMPHAAASEIALATVADWAWNPGEYRPGDSHRRVTAALGLDAALESLIEACSSWPPSAPQHPALSSLLDEVLAQAGADNLRDNAPGGAIDGSGVVVGGQVVGGERDDADATSRARVAFAAMTRPAEPTTPAGERLADELRPWLDAQAAMGRAGLAALDHLTAPSAETRAAAENALADAQACEQNVLKSVVPPFVEATLHRWDAPPRQSDDPNGR
ncbi:beta-N-acetylhexosaminidase [Phytoactinopolyspora alkaliphila]|uniref:Beta-N-acetylhexosaminidase n=1 Tax=Phytoactinopolyspora alkaliphila TaxID=1783498 RepID=A0A6N9YLU5_9ACTN|nr:beta-N-acetylglucosaminidase domain-containing protein [Phytoactinopolyspora alkaliphila]NED95944.1 beta-N-acetylhexosaminidase [Phytoactinopolyspora alkaliphila]